MNLRISVREMLLKREKNGVCFNLHVPELDIFSGQITAILGRSGCGKSTLLDALALILRPTSVDKFIYCDGHGNIIDLDKTSNRKTADLRGNQMGYVLQTGGLLSFLDVKRNICLPSKLSGIPQKIIDRRLDKISKHLEISDHLNKKPQHLSGGQRQRVAIARALLHNPMVVLADEPTAAVDHRSAVEICDIFRHLVTEMNTALVIVSHDEELVNGIADKIINFKIERKSENNHHSTTYEPKK